MYFEKMMLDFDNFVEEFSLKAGKPIPGNVITLLRAAFLAGMESYQEALKMSEEKGKAEAKKLMKEFFNKS